MKLLDEPRPVLAGTSARLCSSRPLGIPAMTSAALKMRCSIWSTESTISLSEYARRIVFWKRRATQT